MPENMVCPTVMGMQQLSQMLVMMQERQRDQSATRKRETSSSRADESSCASLTTVLACSAEPASQAHADAWLVRL